MMREREHKIEPAAFAVAHSSRGAEFVSCKHCGKIGHKEANYYELVGYLANWNTRRDHSGRGRGRGAEVEDDRTRDKDEQITSPENRHTLRKHKK